MKTNSTTFEQGVKKEKEKGKKKEKKKTPQFSLGHPANSFMQMK